MLDAVHGLTTAQVWGLLMTLTGALFTGLALALFWKVARRDEDLEYRECARTLGPGMPAGMPCRTVRNRWKAWRGWIRVVQPSGDEKEFPAAWFGPVLDAESLAESFDVHQDSIEPSSP